MLKLIGPFAQLITMDSLNNYGPLKDEDMQVITDGGILVEEGMIVVSGKFRDLAKGLSGDSIEHVEGAKIAMPGMVDAHTHICYGGSRAHDYSKRISGASYESILAGGGGIHDTIRTTGKSPIADLKEALTVRVNRHFSEGITSIEIKSGYSLDAAGEIRLLKVIGECRESLPADLIPTCLAAHVVPSGYKDPQEYLNYIIGELLPVVKKEKLSNRVDIFIEKNAFEPADGERYLRAAIELGFGFTIHADQFTVGGSDLACRLKAQSADHLEASGNREIRDLAANKIPAVALPGSSLGLGRPFAPARKLLDSGCLLAIASDWNPGSAPMGDLMMQAAVLSAYEKLSNAETFAALTCRAAATLQLNDRGVIAKNKICDVIAFETGDFREILYHQGKLKPSLLWKKGRKFILPKF
jgi:imidazolonepropionase